MNRVGQCQLRPDTCVTMLALTHMDKLRRRRDVTYSHSRLCSPSLPPDTHGHPQCRLDPARVFASDHLPVPLPITMSLSRLSLPRWRPHQPCLVLLVQGAI